LKNYSIIFHKKIYFYVFLEKAKIQSAAHFVITEKSCVPHSFINSIILSLNSMRQSIIYEVTINYIGSLSEVRKREPFVVYFSNLKRAIECIQSNLAVNGWEQKKVNYTAVYRTLKVKNKFVCDFDAMKVKFFQVMITTKNLNPLLTTLGIDEFPTIKK
jgi:hypothetical protein